MKSLEEAIKHCEEVAEAKEYIANKLLDQKSYKIVREDYLKCAKEHRQLAEWLRELKAYRELSTYNRTFKCHECDYEDSEYYCDDCIWNFIDKFKPREVNADADSN